MVSAPPTTRTPKRSPRKARSAEALRSPRAVQVRAASLPKNISYSPNPKARRARSASPGVRAWKGKRTPSRSAKRASGGPSRAAKALTGLLALQAALMGRKVNTPYVGASGKALAVWPLGTSGPNYAYMTRTMAPKYPYTLSEFPAVERVKLRRPLTCGRKACLGGQPNSSLYEPKMTWVKLNGSRMPRKFGEGAWTNFPMPAISAANVLRFEAQGYQLPKSVLKQAHAGMPIAGNYKLSNKTMAALAAKDPRMIPALMKATMPPPSRFNRSRKLELPAGVQKKLLALESRARSVAVGGAAKAAVAPWKVAAKARNLTGRAAASVGRAASYAVSLPSRGRRAFTRSLKERRRLPN